MGIRGTPLKIATLGIKGTLFETYLRKNTSTLKVGVFFVSFQWHLNRKRETENVNKILESIEGRN